MTGVAFAERVRVVTVSAELAAAGFAAAGRRALLADGPADRIAVSEASRYLGSVEDCLVKEAPDAVGLRVLAEDVRGTLVGSSEFAALRVLLDTGSLRHVTVGFVTSLRSGLRDVSAALSPVADRSFAVSLETIDGLLGAALHALADSSPVPAAGVGDSDRHWEPADGASLDGVRVSTVVLGLLGSGRKDFSSPLTVPKSSVSKH